jgi:uncharacterized protein (DUF362 family)
MTVALRARANQHLVGLATADPIAANPYELEHCRDLIREAIASAGYDVGSSAGPFAQIVDQGARVLVKPNWVIHRNLDGGDNRCVTTDPVFLEVVLQEVARARPAAIVVADSPVLFCAFDTLVPRAYRERLTAQCPVPLTFIDLRRTEAAGDAMSRGVNTNLRPIDRYVLFDLGRDSLLEPVSDERPRFRLNDYDDRELARAHHRGCHRYLLCKEAFEAEVVLSVPKLKTHHKVGLTGALKALVGLNGNKDYLPHHRRGGSATGGDSYRGFNPLLELAEHTLDLANRNINRSAYHPLKRMAVGLEHFARRRGAPPICGEWSGNDTAWRMALDLNRILMYGDVHGALQPSRQRLFYSLTDALIAGQGNGPLRPTPLPLGAVTFGSNPAYVDLVHAALLRMDARRLPLIKHAADLFEYPIVDAGMPELEVRRRGEPIDLAAVRLRFGQSATLPIHWRDLADDDSRKGQYDAPLASGTHARW